MTIQEKYNRLIEEKIQVVNNMHKFSDWTEDMEKLEEKLNNQITWMQNRIMNIESMITSDYISLNYK